ncbi:MAG: hypothetical protein WCU88_10095 [Elusimicrobiota bacterium]|jgi:hypothetical protein
MSSDFEKEHRPLEHEDLLLKNQWEPFSFASAIFSLGSMGVFIWQGYRLISGKPLDFIYLIPALVFGIPSLTLATLEESLNKATRIQLKAYRIALIVTKINFFVAAIVAAVIGYFYIQDLYAKLDLKALLVYNSFLLMLLLYKLDKKGDE